MGFARPLTSEPMLTVSKNAFKSQGLFYVAIMCSRGLPTDACKWHRSIISRIIFLNFLKYRGYIYLSPIVWYSTLSKWLIVDIGQDRTNFKTTFFQHPNTQAIWPRHLMHAGGPGVRLYDGPGIKLFILVGWGRSFLSVAWPTDLHRRAAYSICESWFLIHQDVYRDLFVCSWWFID